MGFKEMVKEKWKEGIQIDILFLIFLIFFLNIFITMAPIFFYILILLIIVHLVFGIINKKKRVAMNIVLLILAVLLFLFLIGYFATMLGALIALIYWIIDMIGFFNKKEVVVEEKPVKKVKQK